MAGILGLGLSIFNVGWSAYLTTQVYDISRTTAKNAYIIGELRKHLDIQDHHIHTLIRSMVEFEATTYATTEILSSIKIISELSAQIDHFAKELNDGIHNHRIPYAIFNPSELEENWRNLTNELRRRGLEPVFADRPSQLYELDADYYITNATSFNILINVPVKDIRQITYSLRKTSPTLSMLQGQIFMYEDESFTAINKESPMNHQAISITKKELDECKKYGNTYCCAKTIYQFNNKPCTDELITPKNSPSKECLRNFRRLDRMKTHVVANPHNEFDIYTPILSTGLMDCPMTHAKSIEINQLQTLKLKQGCTFTTHEFKLLATTELDFMPTIHADSRYTIMLTKLLEQVPEIEEALRTALNPINKLLKDEPLTLQDMVDNNDGTYKIMYIVITISSIIAASTILTTIALMRR